MSRIFILLFALLALVNFSMAQKIEVVTSSANLSDLVREIGGDLVNSYALCKPYENPHFLDVNPAYMVRLHRAQLFVETGLEAEPWVTPLLEGARNPDIQRGAIGHVYASQGITVLEIPAVVSRDQGDVHAQGNPHYLLDPVNAKLVSRNIRDGLSRVSPAHGEVFQRNWIAFCGKLRESLVGWLQQVAPHRNKIKVITHHKTWSYFVRRFGIDCIGTIEAKPGIAASSAHLENLIAQMKAADCRLILVEHWFNRKTADYIAAQTGARVVYVTVEVTGEEVKSYLQLFDYLLQAILVNA